ASYPTRRSSDLNLSQSIASGQRILEILDTPRGIRDSRDAADIGRIEGRVTFDHVFFSYDGKEPALEDICLDVPAGSVVGILGPTGAGKSTLVSLIPRFYDVTSGSVSIDGVDVRKIKLDCLRSQIA